MENSLARSQVEVGSVIDETYIIEAMIGRGGMGAVYLASHRRLQGKKVAIKMLHADLGGDEILARFKREADIASQLDHPNIVKVENYNKLADGTPYIVYEYLQGESLAQRLADGGAMPIETVFSILRQIGSGLTAAHRAGIVHRDLKPQNIFLQPSEVDGRAVEVAKVLDFGISKMFGSQTVKTQEATLLGTPQYMAPEQATGQHSNVDQRTDVFALGAIVYEMVSGQPAFSGASIPEVVFKVVYEQPRPLSQVAPNLADVLVLAINKAMAKAPADRYATVGEFVEAMTGSPLSLVRKPKVSGAVAAGSPSQNSKNSSNDAFAQTMGSGDHGFSPVKETLDMPPPVSATAKTVDSQKGVPVPLADVASASTVAQIAVPTIPEKEAEPARRGNAGVIAALALGVIMLGGGGIYLATRGGHEDKKQAIHMPPPQREAVPAKVEDPTPVEKAPVEKAPEIEKAPVERAPDKLVVRAPDRPKVPDNATKPVTKPEATKPAVEATDEAEDETVKQRMRDAEAAYRSNDLAVVERLTNAVIAGDAAKAGAKAHAHALRGIVQCVLHNSEEQARIDLRQLDGYPKMRQRLLSACHAEGHLTSD
ncbi:MAG: protein kinase [Deltaproteobacteria bacterium]